MGQVKLIGALFLIAVFSVAVVSYVSNFGDDNNAAIKLSDDSEISTFDTNVKSELASIVGSTNSTSESFSESTIAAGSETMESGGIFKSITGPVTSVKRVIGLGQSKIFGEDTGFGYVFNSLSAFLIVLLMLYAWKSWKSGSVD